VALLLHPTTVMLAKIRPERPMRQSTSRRLTVRTGAAALLQFHPLQRREAPDAEALSSARRIGDLLA